VACSRATTRRPPFARWPGPPARSRSEMRVEVREEGPAQ
jgi:hypothetical protein